jgi:hypothetical protein
MVFAGQKIAARTSEGKDTMFRIRGQDKTSNEVERYWKRRKIQAENLMPIPSTPPEVRYWTPTPVSRDQSASPDSDYAYSETRISVHIPPACTGSQGSLRAVFGKTVWPRSIVLPPLTSPNQLRDLELILYSTREYYGMCTKTAIDETELHLQRRNTHIFLRDNLTVVASTESGFEASAQLALTRSLHAVLIS